MSWFSLSSRTLADGRPLYSGLGFYGKKKCEFIEILLGKKSYIAIAVPSFFHSYSFADDRPAMPVF